MQDLLPRSFPAHKQDQKDDDSTNRQSGKRYSDICRTKIHMQQYTEEKIEKQGHLPPAGAQWPSIDKQTVQGNTSAEYRSNRRQQVLYRL